MCKKQIYTYENRLYPGQLQSNLASGLISKPFAAQSIIPHKKIKQILKV